MAQENAVEVGENHKRAIGTTLTLLDEMLCEFEEYAQGRERHGVMYHERNSLSDKQRRGIQSEVAAMRRTMRELKEALGLTDSRDEVAQHIWARASAFWEVLVETQSRYLRRYGEFAPGLKECLDPRIEVLIARLLTLVGLIPTLRERPRRAADSFAEGKVERPGQTVSRDRDARERVKADRGNDAGGGNNTVCA